MFLCWIIKACGWSVPHWVTVNFVILCILKVLSVSLVASAIFWQYQIMDGTISSKTITYLFMSCAVLFFVHAQYPDGTVLLKQGTVIGVRFNGIRLHFLNWFTCFYRNTKAKHLLHFLIISTSFGICLFQLKIFPETSKTAVYSYLGIPYAQPPTGSLRFAVSLNPLLFFYYYFCILISYFIRFNLAIMLIFNSPLSTHFF